MLRRPPAVIGNEVPGCQSGIQVEPRTKRNAFVRPEPIQNRFGAFFILIRPEPTTGKGEYK